jgi:hypothetical protein
MTHQSVCLFSELKQNSLRHKGNVCVRVCVLHNTSKQCR